MWLSVPTDPTTSPSSASVAVAAASTSASNWPFPQLASSVGWNGKLSPPRVWWRRWRTVPFLRLLCGPTSAPSTADRGVASWIASRRAIRASRSASPVSVVETTIRATCGPMFTALSTKYALPSSCWRTSAVTSASALPTSGPTWKQAATTLRQRSLQRRKSARAISGNGSLSSAWTTPQAHDVTERGSGQVPTAEAGNACLARDARLWNTPRTITGGGESGKRKQELGRTESGGGDLQAQVENWPTPSARDADKWHNRAPGHARQVNLSGMAHNWPTPRAEDSESSGARLSRGTADTLTAASRSFLPDPPTPTPGAPSSPSGPTSRRRLNPRFVAYLMGWPEAHEPNGSGSTATAWCHYRQRMHSAYSGLVGT